MPKLSAFYKFLCGYVTFCNSVVNAEQQWQCLPGVSISLALIGDILNNSTTSAAFAHYCQPEFGFNINRGEFADFKRFYSFLQPHCYDVNNPTSASIAADEDPIQCTTEPS